MHTTEELQSIHVQVLEHLQSISKNFLGNDQEVLVSFKADLPSQSSIVTDVDIRIDQYFRENLSKSFPAIGFITEEGDAEVKEVNWVIDPIDGTGNFSHGFPFFGISVALWEGNEPIYGCIYLPRLSTTVYAIKGRGAWQNDQDLHFEDQKEIKSAYVLIAPVAGPALMGQAVEAIGEAVAHPRDFGCCVFQVVQTLLGRADVMVGLNLSLWDMGAAVVIAQEAGASWRYVSPEPDALKTDGNTYKHTFVFGRPELVNKLEPVLRKLIAG